MNARTLRRFIFLMAVATILMFVFWDVIDDYVERAPGDYHTEVGSYRLEDGLFDEAIEHFGLALQEAPDHRGALMGRALVFIQTEQYADAIDELDYLIETLHRTTEPDDATGIGVLAAAYANRGIVHDRIGEYEKALEDYIEALETDVETVSGPGIVHKILHGADDLSTVRDRAEYLHSQFQLPESERVLRIPEIDDQQRMYKP